MNWETILVAAIAALGPLLGTILTIKQQNRLIDYRMGQVESSIKGLSAKVDKHNSFDRRLIVIETKLGIETPKEKAS
jgi:hypothetical protein